MDPNTDQSNPNPNDPAANKDQEGAANENTVPSNVPFKLKAKGYDVNDPNSRKLMPINEEILKKDLSLLKWFAEKHPDCFDQLPVFSAE